MEAQIKRSILEVCVLSVLEREKSYGYKLVKDISEIIDISESTLYPILKRLENSKMLIVSKEEHDGRLRKYYQITDVGIERISDLLLELEEIIRIYQYIKDERRREKV